MSFLFNYLKIYDIILSEEIMKRFFGRKEKEKIYIENDEFFHLKKVMRLNEGDKIIACIDDQNDYYCRIEKLNKDFCICQIEEIKLNEANPKKNIVLFQMMPKKEYFDNIIPKAIELGVNEITFFSSKWTINKNFKDERVENMVITACKQCERSKLVKVNSPIPFDKMIEKLSNFDKVIFAYENSNIPFRPSMIENAGSIAIIIGNEAGFTDEESKKLAKISTTISLGKRILRCDTAVVATLSLIGILSGN